MSAVGLSSFNRIQKTFGYVKYKRMYNCVILNFCKSSSNYLVEIKTTFQWLNHQLIRIQIFIYLAETKLNVLPTELNRVQKKDEA